MDERGDLVLPESAPVYVAAFPDPRPDHPGIAIETRLLSTTENPVALAFTTLPKLVAAMGEAQPWVAVPLEALRGWVGAVGIETVAVDPEVPLGARRWRPIDVAALDALIIALRED